MTEHGRGLGPHQVEQHPVAFGLGQPGQALAQRGRGPGVHIGRPARCGADQRAQQWWHGVRLGPAAQQLAVHADRHQHRRGQVRAGVEQRQTLLGAQFA